MKKALRIIVPLVLVLAVIGSTCWYLLVYDPGFTRDMLLHQARHMESIGNHQAAAWFYDLAYQQSRHDDAVAIELANQYKDVGNYTKAEYTLANAISDGASAELYMALCKTYVEQDKLLDAVNMLDSIEDAAIKAELDALRPKAPVSDLEPGFYSKYHNITLTTDSGTVYAAMDGQYPSTGDDPCTAPIKLPAGETTIYAVAVSSTGLVSPLSIYGYTVGGVIEPVTFADAAVEASLRAALNASNTKVIYTDELWAITEFTMPLEATSYGDLALLPYLKSLTIENATAGELGYLAKLTQLEELILVSSKPTSAELTAIASLPELKRLTMADCNLSSIAELSAAAGLEYLNLNYNTLRNLSPLSAAANLQELYLSHNAVTDLTALTGLKKLTKLDVSYNSLTVIDPICATTTLTELDVSNNQISSLGNLSALKALTRFNAAQNALTDVSQLASCTALQQVDISNNAVKDITSFSSLTAITELKFANNEVKELPKFAKGCPLITVDGSHNQIEKLDRLSGLKALNNVLMDYNEKLKDLTPLKNCPMLIQVNVYGTKVTEVSFLTEQSVIVNFNPTQK